MIDVVILDIPGDGGQVIAHIEQVHLREALTQEGRQGIGVGVADHQHLGSIGLLGLDDAQGLIAAQEEGILVLLIQVLLHIQLPLLGLAGEVGGDLLPLLGHEGVHEVGGQPAHTGRGEGGAVKVLRHGDGDIITQRQLLHTQRTKDGVGTIESAQRSPVVVGAVENIVVLLLQQGTGHVQRDGIGIVIELLNDGKLIGSGCAVGQATWVMYIFTTMIL